MSHRDYPETVLEVLEERLPYRASALTALQDFAAFNPWQGSLVERKAKLRELNRMLSRAYHINPPGLRFNRIDGSSSGDSHYIPTLHRIVIVGKLSVITYLHEFGHARGMGERAACRWSINLFRRVFPKQYARLVGRGHMLLCPTSITRTNGCSAFGESK